MARVFLVDDDIDLVEQNKMVLKDKHDVFAAYSAKEALSVLESDRPDIMVVDVMMEHRTAGLNLAKEIGKRYPEVPLVILSGDTTKETWMQESNQTWKSVVKFLDKPVVPERLAQVLDEVLST